MERLGAEPWAPANSGWSRASQNWCALETRSVAQSAPGRLRLDWFPHVWWEGQPGRVGLTSEVGCAGHEALRPPLCLLLRLWEGRLGNACFFQSVSPSASASPDALQLFSRWALSCSGLPSLQNQCTNSPPQFMTKCPVWLLIHKGTFLKRPWTSGWPAGLCMFCFLRQRHKRRDRPIASLPVLLVNAWSEPEGTGWLSSVSPSAPAPGLLLYPSLPWLGGLGVRGEPLASWPGMESWISPIGATTH